jgi:O-antigen/teichoic acid export membrane protein
MGTQVATFVLTFGDRYFLNKAGGASVVGIYGLAYQFAFMLVALGYTPFNRAWSPARFEIARMPNRDELYARAFVYMNVLLLSMAVILSLFTKDVLRIMSAPEFHGAATLVPVLLLASIFHIWSSYHNLGIFIRERTEYYTLATWISALVVLVGYIWLVPRWFAWGAAVATVIAYAVRFVVVYRVSQKLWFVQYRWGPVIRLLAVAVLVSTAGSLAPEMKIGYSLLLRLALCALYAVAVWMFEIISEADRAFLRQALRAPRATVSALMG